MLDGDVDKRKLWEEILKCRVETGEPYLFFTDNVNNNNPECYKQNNLTVKTSNICCLSGDTLVLTDSGYQRIDSLVDKKVKVFDGENWLFTNSFSQRGIAPLYRIHLANGTFVDCTDNHRWFVASNYTQIRNKKYTELQTKDLQVGQWLEYHSEKTSGTTEIKTAYEKSNRKSTGWRRIVEIEALPGKHPVYCPTIPTTGKFALANGLMTGNSEIALYTDPDHTFVCCLSSLNLVRWEEWKNTDLVNTAVRFLDAVLEEYIQKTAHIKGMEASRRSAIKGRAIGIGVLGWHTFLQERNLAFDSFDSMQLNAQIFKHIRRQAEEETKILAEELGEPEWCRGFGRRNTHLCAIAPTVSNSTISGGYSQGIEPISANIYVQKSAKGAFIRKNPTLEKLLESKGNNTSEIWSSINQENGSVQHLTCLTPEEKEVFLTAREINQHAIVKQAVQRQRWIDQAQSVNLFFAANSSPKYIHQVHINAWKNGLKTLYYLRTDGVIKSDLASRSEDECKACEG
jgi:ribonucleotide reductase alpha subunit